MNTELLFVTYYYFFNSSIFMHADFLIFLLNFHLLLPFIAQGYLVVLTLLFIRFLSCYFAYLSNFSIYLLKFKLHLLEYSQIMKLFYCYFLLLKNLCIP